MNEQKKLSDEDVGDARKDARALADDIAMRRETRVRKPSGPGLAVPGILGSGDASLPPELRNFDPGPGIQAVDEADFREKYDQKAQWDAMQEERRKQQEAALAREASEYQWYIRCHVCHEHGIYLKGPVTEGDILTLADWTARYKPKPTDFWDRPPLCQACLKGGVETQLRVRNLDVWKRTFNVIWRWTWKVHRDPVRARIEGNFRALMGPYAAANMHIDDVESRRRAWDDHQKNLAEKKEREARG